MKEEIILSEVEASILDAHGYDVLQWLQNNYLIYKGEWGDDVMPEEQGLLIALAKKTIAEKRGDFIKKRVDAHLDIVPRIDEINRIHNQMVEALTNIYGKSVMTRPIAAGQTAVSADIIRINPFFKGREERS